jgi:hypothetical protein
VHLPRDLRRERQPGRLAHRQRVHVGADRDGRARLAAFEHGDDAGAANAGAEWNGELGQEFLHALRRLVLLERKLGCAWIARRSASSSSDQRSTAGATPSSMLMLFLDPKGPITVTRRISRSARR